MIKKNTKYSYAHGIRYMDHGSRNYEVAGYRLPSVTTILKATESEEKKASLHERQKQIELAKARGEKHIGREFGDSITKKELHEDS